MAFSHGSATVTLLKTKNIHNLYNPTQKRGKGGVSRRAEDAEVTPSHGHADAIDQQRHHHGGRSTRFTQGPAAFPKLHLGLLVAGNAAATSEVHTSRSHGLFHQRLGDQKDPKVGGAAR